MCLRQVDPAHERCIAPVAQFFFIDSRRATHVRSKCRLRIHIAVIVVIDIFPRDWFFTGE